MNENKTTLERAFELARSGQCPDMNVLRRTLAAERYNLTQLNGAQLLKQLRQAIKDAQPA